MFGPIPPMEVPMIQRIVFVTSCLILASAPANRARAEENLGWTGQHVMPKHPNLLVKHDLRRRGQTSQVENSVFDVLEDRGDFLLATWHGRRGWVRKENVVLQSE